MKKLGVILLPAVAVGSLLSAQTALSAVDYEKEFAKLLEVTVYGKVNVSYQKEDEDVFGTETDDAWYLNSNASRLGVKGDYKLADDLKAVYKLEYEIYVNGDNDAAPFKARNIYGGLQGEKWGTFLAGRNDTALKLAQHKFDQFNDLQVGDIKNVVVAENRLDNMLMYQTPDYSGLNFTIQAAPGNGDDDGAFDYYSAAIIYKGKDYPLRVALAANNDIDNMNVYRLVLDIPIGKDIKLGFLGQTAKGADSGDSLKFDGFMKTVNDTYSYETIDDETIATVILDKQNGGIFNVAYKFHEDLVFKAQYGYALTEGYVIATSADAALETVQYNLGVEYKLSKKANVYGYYGYNKTHDEENLESTDNATAKTGGIGMELKF